MTATEQTLPHWDLTDLFPSIGSREYAAAREELGADLSRLTALYDEHDVRGGDDKTVDDATVQAFEQVLDETNAVMDRTRVLGAYLNSHVTTDARDDLAQGELSQLQAELSQLSRLRSRFDAWVASLGDEELTARSTAAADHAYPLQRSTQRAAHQMSEAEEGLLADLSLTGSTAWVRLYGTFTSQLVVDVAGHGPMPMSRARGLAYDADAATRRAAYEAELATWKANDVTIIAALNAIKGEAATVNRRRGWADDLEPALVANGVDRPTLEAMQAAVTNALPDFRRYLRTKARLLGHGDDAGLPFHDLFAPLGDGDARRWDEATDAVRTTFGTYSPQLEDLARRAVDERWIDAEPRDGKRDGAFCMSVTDDRSAVLLNFDGSFRSVQTLAHELGHAYHNVTLAQRTPLQRQLPMALAETASIFCETIMVQHGLATAAEGERLALIEGDLQSACQVVVDIHSRFLFERSFCEARAKRTVSSAEACQLMLDAQEASYGDGLDADLRHPYMWAAKPHYYSSAFYNWPYTFGLLFGLGLYARYTEDPDRFRGGYDDLLSSCGLASAADLAGRFGIDVRDTAFWAASLRVLQDRIGEFVALAAASTS
jgi:pepF/M3 family oligoendopeptidase